MIVLDPRTNRWSYECPECHQKVASDLMAQMAPLIEIHRINDAASRATPPDIAQRCFVLGA